MLTSEWINFLIIVLNSQIIQFVPNKYSNLPILKFRNLPNIEYSRIYPPYIVAREPDLEIELTFTCIYIYKFTFVNGHQELPLCQSITIIDFLLLTRSITKVILRLIFLPHFFQFSIVS